MALQLARTERNGVLRLLLLFVTSYNVCPQKHGSIEGMLKELDPAKYPVPEPFPHKESHEFFKNPEVRLTGPDLVGGGGGRVVGGSAVGTGR